MDKSIKKIEYNIKIKCNSCYKELEVVEYDCGVFIEPCETCMDDKYNTGYDNGFEQGYDEDKHDAVDAMEICIHEI